MDLQRYLCDESQLLFINVFYFSLNMLTKGKNHLTPDERREDIKCLKITLEWILKITHQWIKTNIKPNNSILNSFKLINYVHLQRNYFLNQTWVCFIVYLFLSIVIDARSKCSVFVVSFVSISDTEHFNWFITDILDGFSSVIFLRKGWIFKTCLGLETQVR